jgi:hypothetical protein
MDRNFNIDDSFNNLSVTTKNVSRVSNNIISSINVIDTTVEQKGSGVDNFSSLPIGGTIKIEGKYPERNYITFNIDLLSSITPYSSNIYVPVSNRITNQTPTNNTSTPTDNTTTLPSNQYPPIGRVGNVDGESVALNNIVWIWDEDTQRWFEERFDDRD